MRPAYDTLLEYVRRGRGVHWTINSVTFHVGALTGHTRSSAEELLVEIKRPPIALSCQRDPLDAHGIVCLEPM